MADDSFKSFVLDQLSALPELRAKAMFGGHGLYQGSSFFAILFEGRLYFKTDVRSQADYAARGMEPFTYEMKGRRMTMSYYEVPPDILESRTDIVIWARRAVRVAALKRPTKSPRKRRSTGKLIGFVLAAALFAAGCGGPAETRTLAEARQGFTTRLIHKQSVNEAVPGPPPKLFRSVTYASPIGEMAAYVGVSPGDGKKHPAIIWIAGGFDNSIGDFAWAPAIPANDQSGSAFRKAGIVMMYPSLRGGNRNPGSLEGFFGEVNDVLAAADYLAKQEYVDPGRIYLGGHSTGGTLALLVAESSDRFRAVFAFGPVGTISSYGQDNLPFRISNRKEVLLRSPIGWLHAIRNPTFVLEGTQESNISALNALERRSRNPLIQFHRLNGADHFSGLAPVSRLIAEKILSDGESSPNISFTKEELAGALRR